MSDENFRNVFSRNLKRYMEQYEINNVELSKNLGVSESTVGKWLLKKSVPRMGIIEKLSIIFNIEKSDLIEDKHQNQKQDEITLDDIIRNAKNIKFRNGNYQPSDEEKEILIDVMLSILNKGRKK